MRTPTQGQCTQPPWWLSAPSTQTSLHCTLSFPDICSWLFYISQDPLGAALHRADSQSTPYLTNNTTPAAATGNSPRISTPGGALSPFGRSGSSSTAAPAASPGVTAGAGSSSGSMLDRLRRVGSSSGSVGSTSGSPTAAAASGAGGGAGVQQSGHSTQQQSSRLSKVTGGLV